MKGIDPLIICEFNFSPSKYIHDSWLESLSINFPLVKLREHPRILNRIDNYLLNQLKLSDQFWFDFSDPIHRIALLSNDELAKIALYTGLVLNANVIKKTISREQVLHIKTSLGDEAYKFAVKRATELAPKTAAPSFTWSYSESSYKAHATVCGLKCIAIPFAGNDPAAIVQRLLLKLPMNWHRSFIPPYVSDEERATINSLLPAIAKEVLQS
ncbi:MAG: SctK family type III secretion system sorting platform protein [Candidatus Competibacterales bacterium]